MSTHTAPLGTPPSLATPAWRSASPTQEPPRADARSRERERSRRRLRLRECALIAASYATNAVLLALFAWAGTTDWRAAALYGGPGLALCGAAAFLIARGNLREPKASTLHSTGNVLLCLTGAAFCPELAFAYALTLFTTMLNATNRLPQWQVHVLVAITMVGFAAVTLGLGRTLRLPTDTVAERLITWVYFIVTLGRSVLLSVVSTRHNRLLRDRGVQMQEKLAEIERLAHHDELTGVLNRRRLLQLLADEMARHDRGQGPLCVVLFDLDHFKVVNDTLGHLSGDTVLRRFARTVDLQTRSTDRFGRYGGEEFLLILSGADAHTALTAIDRMREVVAQLDWSDLAPDLRITFSAGIARYTGEETAEVLLSRADLGLYEAKHAGRNCSRAL